VYVEFTFGVQHLLISLLIYIFPIVICKKHLSIE
jgi:hypothetical protein